MTTAHIEVDHIARIEGHGDIRLSIEDGKVSECRFEVTEPARLFESMVKGRYFEEIPYIASRVCGICSASHTVTDILAIEHIFDVEVTDRTQALRELLLYGSYLQNHATHLFVFAAPDFLGHKSVFPLADANENLFNNALGLKKLGNDLCTQIGGRSIHPITAVVGGFTSEISKSEYLRLAERLEEAVPFALSTVDLFNDFGSVDFKTAGDLFAMVADSTTYKGSLNDQGFPYPIGGSDTARFLRGDEATGGAYDIDVQHYEEDIEEYPVDHSAAFLAKAKRTGNTYFASALSRINASWDGLTEEARFAAAKAGLRPPEFNPFANNIAQAVEIIDSLVRCAAICRRLAADEFEGSSKPVDFEIKAGRGVGFTEAPRGALFHDLELDGEGKVVRADIITPTSQNIANIERDMHDMAVKFVEEDRPESYIQLEIEKLVRAYDPCLSCSVH